MAPNRIIIITHQYNSNTLTTTQMWEWRAGGAICVTILCHCLLSAQIRSFTRHNKKRTTHVNRIATNLRRTCDCLRIRRKSTCYCCRPQQCEGVLVMACLFLLQLPPASVIRPWIVCETVFVDSNFGIFDGQSCNEQEAIKHVLWTCWCCGIDCWVSCSRLGGYGDVSQLLDCVVLHFVYDERCWWWCFDGVKVW